MTEMIRLTAAQMAEGMRAGEFTSTELVQAHLDRIAAVDGGDRGINAFLHVSGEEALATAAEVDKIRAAGGGGTEALHRWPGCRSR